MEFNFAVTVSTLSLLVSIFTYWRQRKRATVNYDSNCYLLNPKKDIQDASGVAKEIQATRAIYTTVKIVNASQVNMSYFDLRAFNPQTNENHFVATQRTIPLLRNQPSMLISPFGPDTLDNFFITLPERNYGALPAGSCTSVDILVFLNDHVDTTPGIVIELKTSDTSLFHRSPWSTTKHKKYRAHHQIYYLLPADELPKKKLSLLKRILLNLNL